MKITPILIGDLSGSIGGATAAKAKGGIQYLRARVTPVNPRTFLQTAIRSAVTSVSSAWQNLLTETQQQGWWDIATGSQQGKTLFAKVNQPRIYANNTDRITDSSGSDTDPLALIVNAPESTSTSWVAPAATIDDSANTLALATVEAGDWNTGADAPTPSVVYVYLSGPQLPSRFSREKPYQLIRAYTVDVPDPVELTAINLAALGIPSVTGRVFYVKLIAQAPDGRVSTPVEQRVTVVA